MTSVLLYTNPASGAVLRASDFKAAGMNVLEVVEDRHKLVQCVVRHAPDVLVCVLGDTDEAHAADDAFFSITKAIAESAPCAIMVFTPDESAERIVQATTSGVHAYVINGYARARLPSLVRVAQARFAHERALQQSLADVSGRLEERKVVERAKTILMRARALSDDDAFRLLRTASMHSNQRLGQVSQHIIHSAHFAEGVNRAGQLRMLSQRLIKLHVNIHLRQAAQLPLGAQAGQLHDSVQRIEANLIWLRSSFPKFEIGDSLDGAEVAWAELKRSLKARPKTSTMARMDNLAEQLLQGAEDLTSNLEAAGSIAPLQVLNRAGRQRMLSQRFAKYAFLDALLQAQMDGQPDAQDKLGKAALTRRIQLSMAETGLAFEQAQHYLNNIPLSSPAIRTLLEAAKQGWQKLLAGAGDTKSATGQTRLAVASEELLDVFEQLSANYESSMQMLIG